MEIETRDERPPGLFWIGASSLVKIWRLGTLGFRGKLRGTGLHMDLDCVGVVGRRTRGIGAWVSRESWRVGVAQELRDDLARRRRGSRAEDEWEWGN